MALRSIITRRFKFGVDQVLKPTAPRTGAVGATTSGSSTTLMASGAAPVLALSRRHLRVTHTPPMMPPPPPINVKYNYAAFAVVLIVFAWAALSPDDDGFDSLLRGAGYEDDDEDDDDDESYDGAGYEGRDKAVTAGSASR